MARIKEIRLNCFVDWEKNRKFAPVFVKIHYK